jgi:hypothetical protein
VEKRQGKGRIHTAVQADGYAFSAETAKIIAVHIVFSISRRMDGGQYRLTLIDYGSIRVSFGQMQLFRVSMTQPECRSFRAPDGFCVGLDLIME